MRQNGTWKGHKSKNGHCGFERANCVGCIAMGLAYDYSGLRGLYGGV